MRRSKLYALVICFAILMPLFTSCNAGTTGKKTVKADEPWYGSTRFKIEKELKENDEEGVSSICAGSDRVYSLYCYSSNRWASSKAVLDIYDDDGNMVSRKKVTCPGDYSFTNIYSVSADPDGRILSAVVRYYSYSDRSYFAFADIDTETGNVTNVSEIKHKGGTGISYAICIKDYTIIVGLDVETTTFSYVISLYKNNQFVSDMDMSSVNLVLLFDGFALDENSGLLYAAGYDRNGLITMEFDINSGRLKNRNSGIDTDSKSVNIADFSSTDKGELCKLDSFGNIIRLDINTLTEQTAVDTDWYTPYFSSPNTDESTSGSKILSLTEDRVVILDSGSTTYGNLSSTSWQCVRVLKKADKNPNAGKEIIEIAMPLNSGVSDYLARSIYEFNRTDNEYVVRVWNKYKAGFNIGRNPFGIVDEDDQKTYQMIQDLRGDDAPDLVIGIQKNYAMRDDIFMDLSGMLDPEVMEKQFGNIIEAGRINGKLYFLPVTLEIEGLVTNKELLKDGASGITFDDFDKLIKDKLNGFSPYDHAFTDSYNKRDFILSCIDTKRAIEGEKIEFGTEQFRAAVQYAKENIPFDKETDLPEGYQYDFKKRYRGECYYAVFDDYLDYVRACCSEKGEYTIIGTPSEDASGPRFKALETISVSAMTTAKDGCRKFMNYLFAGSALTSDQCEFKHIVTNKDVMDKIIRTLTEINNKDIEFYMASKESKAIIVPSEIERAYGDKPATDEMRERFLNSLSAISVYYYEDHAIIQFLDEELAPFFAGDRSIDDAIKYINDRTAKYVREM